MQAAGEGINIFPCYGLFSFVGVREGNEAEAAWFASIAILDDLHLDVAEPPEGILYILLKREKLHECHIGNCNI